MNEQILTQQEQTLSLQAIEQEQKSIKPSIEESERFIRFLDSRFNLNLPNNLIVLIHETRPNIKGFFRSIGCSKIWKEGEQPINSIVLSSHTLQEAPFETLAHEIAHFINFNQGVKDCSGSQYHNKYFKAQAERLLLKVERDKRKGYAYTSETQEFKEMLKEFNPDPQAFKVFQEVSIQEQKPKGRLLLFMCPCGCKIRTARNENKPLKAVCQYCNDYFQEVTQ